MVKETAILVAIGAAVGIALSLAAAPAVGALLYGIAPADPTTLALSVAALALIAVAATAVPGTARDTHRPGCGAQDRVAAGEAAFEGVIAATRRRRANPSGRERTRSLRAGLLPHTQTPDPSWSGVRVFWQPW